MSASEKACAICGSRDALPLSNPRRDASIGSDLRIVGRPLEKVWCSACGAIAYGAQTPAVVVFDQDYTLYAHEAGRMEEVRRQSGYARWLAGHIDAPSSVFEAGCGNGSLLLALKEFWPGARLSGIEPAPGAVRAAKRRGLSVECGILNAQAVAAAGVADIALSINVIEHVLSPSQFVRSLVSAGRRIAVVCPDGSVPNVELLFIDHLHSFTPAHIARLFEDNGLRVDLQVSAPSAIGDFQLTIGTPHGSFEPTASSEARPFAPHEAYLRAWTALDASLMRRLPAASTVSCFGAGEAAGLLRAYAPQTWSRVERCVVDHPDSSVFGELPVESADTIREGETILMGVRPAVQAALSDRVARLGCTALRWDDMISR